MWKTRLCSNLAWLFGIGTYLVLNNDVPYFVICLLGGTTITSFVLGISFIIDDDEEENKDEEDKEEGEESVEQLSSCIGFTYYPD